MRDFCFATFAVLRWIVIILYIVCFGCYVLFTRQPDCFDSERTIGTITEQQQKMVAVFSDGHINQQAEVVYPYFHTPGEKVTVIYETADTAKAKVYSFFGYWISFGEIIASLFIAIALYWVAVSVTSNPTPEALIEELEMGKKKPRKPKYDS